MNFFFGHTCPHRLVMDQHNGQTVHWKGSYKCFLVPDSCSCAPDLWTNSSLFKIDCSLTHLVLKIILWYSKSGLFSLVCASLRPWFWKHGAFGPFTCAREILVHWNLWDWNFFGYKCPLWPFVDCGNVEYEICSATLARLCHVCNLPYTQKPGTQEAQLKGQDKSVGTKARSSFTDRFGQTFGQRRNQVMLSRVPS